MNPTNLIWSLSLNVPAWQMKASLPHPVGGQNPFAVTGAAKQGGRAVCSALTDSGALFHRLEAVISQFCASVRACPACQIASTNHPHCRRSEYETEPRFQHIYNSTYCSVTSVSPPRPSLPFSFSPAPLTLPLQALTPFFCQHHSSSSSSSSINICLFEKFGWMDCFRK